MRLGLGLLVAGAVLAWQIKLVGASGLFLAWGLSALGFLLLRREAATRQAAHAGLAVLVVLIAGGALLAGVSVGLGDRLLAVSPAIDPTLAAAAFAFTASISALAVFLAVMDARQGRWLAPTGAASIFLAGALFAWSELQEASTDVAFAWLLGLGALLLVVALVRVLWGRNDARALWKA